MNVNVLDYEPGVALFVPNERNYQSASSDTAWYEKGSDYFYKVIIGWNGGDEEEQEMLFQHCIDLWLIINLT